MTDELRGAFDAWEKLQPFWNQQKHFVALSAWQAATDHFALELAKAKAELKELRRVIDAECDYKYKLTAEIVNSQPNMTEKEALELARKAIRTCYYPGASANEPKLATAVITALLTAGVRFRDGT